MKPKTVTLEGKTHIICDDIVIRNKGEAFTTEVFLDGKPLGDIGNIQSFKYEVTVAPNEKNSGKAKLTLVYYPKTYIEADPKELLKKVPPKGD